jgi:microcystin-dependent protein
MFDVLPIAWTICQKQLIPADTLLVFNIVGLQLGGRIVGTVVLVGGGCLRANGTGHQLEGRPRQGLY